MVGREGVSRLVRGIRLPGVGMRARTRAARMDCLIRRIWADACLRGSARRSRIWTLRSGSRGARRVIMGVEVGLALLGGEAKRQNELALCAYWT